MKLTDFLKNFDFDYNLYYSEEGLQIGLKDLKNVNLGNIESERFANNTLGTYAIIDRLDIYFKDYIFDDLAELLNDEYDIKVSKDDWAKIYDLCKRLHINDNMELLPYIFLEKNLTVDSYMKAITM